MSDHSPVPLNSKGRHIYDSKGENVATVASWWSVSRDGEREAPTAENAAFIVRACNAHDDLVKALESMLDPSHVCGEDCRMEKPCPVGEQARAALAKAKGEMNQ